MKKILVIAFFLLATVISYAQSPRIDSINNLVTKATSDTQRINLLVSKVALLGEINIDSAVNLAQQLIEQSKKISYVEGEAAARVKLSNSYCFKGKYTEAAENLKAAENVYLRIRDTAGLGDVYMAMGMMYGMTSKYDSSIPFFKKSLTIAEKMHNQRMVNSSLQNLGVSYQMLSNYSQALVYQQKALKLAQENNDVKGESYVTLNMGLNYTAIGDTGRGEQLLLRAIGLSKKAGIKNVELYAVLN